MSQSMRRLSNRRPISVLQLVSGISLQPRWGPGLQECTVLELQYVVEMAAAAPPVPPNKVESAVPGLAVVRLRGHAVDADAAYSTSACSAPPSAARGRLARPT